MNKISNVLIATAFVAAVAPSKIPISDHLEKEPSSINESLNPVKWSNEPSYKFHRTGKKLGNQKLDRLYTKSSMKSFDQFPMISPALMDGLNNQIKLLKARKRNTKNYGDLSITADQTKRTVELLQKYHDQPGKLVEALDAFQIKGKDQKGNVHFTGYFTPVLKVSKTKNAEYKYPLYNRPKNWKGKLPSRAEIANGALDSLGLELAFAKNAVDAYFMQVQGSGIVEYRDGSHELYSYNGGNGHPYNSIGKFMIKQGIADEANVSIARIKKFVAENPHMRDSILSANANFIFFEPTSIENKTKGAGLVPLTPEHSIAVDPDFIPLGSCLLAAVPVYNKSGNCTHHEFKILIAQDVGGAINGPGHVDVYEGIGQEGRSKATQLHHYGALWLLLAPENDKNKPVEVLRAGV